jgi:hypothetical protein
MRWIVTLIVLGFFISMVSAESMFISDHLEEGRSTVYEVDNGVYVISLLAVGDETSKAVFKLNDETSKAIKRGDSYVFKDGSELVVKELIITEANEGTDIAYFYFYGTGNGALPLKNVSRYVLDNKLCNFDGQCVDENKETCCYDCGCDSGECVNNECVLPKEENDAPEERLPEVNVTPEVREEAEADDGNGMGAEKKVGYTILIVIFLFAAVIMWNIWKKRKKVF